MGNSCIFLNTQDQERSPPTARPTIKDGRGASRKADAAPIAPKRNA